MLGIENFWTFLIASLLLNLAPGPDNFYIIGRSVAQGPTAGVVSTLGIITGVLVHLLIGAIGLSALLVTSSYAFAVIKYAGAAYLIYLGIRMLLEKRTPSLPNDAGPRLSPAKIFVQGFLTNLLNPKVALFFLAFIPQFIAASSPNRFLSFMVLGATFAILGLFVCILIALSAAYVSARFRRSANGLSLLGKLNGALFVYLGVRLAYSD